MITGRMTMMRSIGYKSDEKKKKKTVACWGAVTTVPHRVQYGTVPIYFLLLNERVMRITIF